MSRGTSPCLHARVIAPLTVPRYGKASLADVLRSGLASLGVDRRPQTDPHLLPAA